MRRSRGAVINRMCTLRIHGNLHAHRDGIQLIRRYSGGGTVVCDASTLFVSLVMNHAHVSAKPYPRDIMTWTADTLYAPLFGRFTAAAFALRENDYVFGDAKFGGNAQSISRDRWVHHTSFLWDFDSRMMGYLQQPRKQPEYRLNREHGAFLTRLSSYIPSVSDFEAALKVEFEKHFEVDSVSQQQCEAIVADLRLSNSEATVCRTKLESAEAVLSEMRRVPSLIRTGPSCVNL